MEDITESRSKEELTNFKGFRLASCVMPLQSFDGIQKEPLRRVDGGYEFQVQEDGGKSREVSFKAELE
ncbi:hypothetical protein KFK09_020018 [Dendrobium nobile]|uniref:Uncharacterized protein n=1 Tax=Dendrobium nobile TaxID=94219 RepID=A0A8T3ASN1_DENNO|nr:hypothetical protein KFK09_020018 [Dendrobium nobile]